MIAAVEGHAVAGGLELALWCDLRVAAEDAVLGVFCRRWGVPLIDGGTVRLPRLIGTSRALDLILTGRAVGADEAAADGPRQPGRRDRARRSPRPRALAARARGVPPGVPAARPRSRLLEQEGRTETEALAGEYVHGLRSLAGALEGAARFAPGRVGTATF